MGRFTYFMYFLMAALLIKGLTFDMSGLIQVSGIDFVIAAAAAVLFVCSRVAQDHIKDRRETKVE